MTSREGQVAELHRRCLDGSFLATLGIPFLTLMYEAMAEADDAFLITEQRDSRVVGFVTGGVAMRGTYRRMLLHPVRLATALAPALVRPSHLRKIWDILRYGSKDDPAVPKAELLSIAVDPSHRGAGVADSLYRQLVAEFRARGVSRFRITVGATLDPAHRFYRRMGAAVVAETMVHGGERSLVYVHDAGTAA